MRVLTRPRVPAWRLLSSSLWAALLALSCTDAGLQPQGGDIVYVDDKLSITGHWCSSQPDEVAFPVKLLIVIDQSASLQCTDAGNNRLTALSQAGSSLDALPNVEFGVVGFSSWSRITEFTPDWSVAADALAPEGDAGGPATDYQGALATTLSMLEQDMLDAGPAEVARTRYIVLFMSDGIPEPRCNAGCDDGDEPPDSLYGVCNYTGEIDEEDYVDMHTQCPDYNQEDQILQKVADIMALGDFYGVGDISFNTVLLFADEAEVEEVCPGAAEDFGYVRDEALPLMQAMATDGNGTFRDVNISTDIDFLDLDYESLQAPYDGNEFFVLNTNTVPSENGPAMDSDGDGVPDSVEFDAGTDRLNRDTDGDHFSDLFELLYEHQGFDPLDADVPGAGCSSTSDRDGDGLLACEEDFIDTDDTLPDTDGDRIPDGVELRLGIDPTVHDVQVDHDFDGRLSGTEVRAGTHPQLYDEEDALLNQVRYSIDPGARGRDGSRCYGFVFENITLVPTISDTADKGYNRILIYAEEEPAGLAGSRGRMHVACVEARYLGDTFKDPPSGQIDDLTSARFIELQEFDPDVHCLTLGEDPTQPPADE